MRRFNKSGQIWVETVIYTLIGLAIMGLILAMAKPKIEEKRDDIVVEQAIEAMRNINDKIYEVQRSPGNRRSVDLSVGRGVLTIDAVNNTLSWKMDISYMYSEKDYEVPLGGLTVTTTEASPWAVTLKMDYNFDIQYEGQETTRDLTVAPTPYLITLENKGKDSQGNFIIDIKEV